MKTDKKLRPSADQTRAAILKAAQKLFAQHGFAGTSISTIAKKAKINQSLIYHHFGSKEELWRQTKAESLHQYFNLTDINELFNTKNLTLFLNDYVTKRFEYYEKNPDLRRMIFWQRLETNRELHGVEKGNKFFTETLRNVIIKLQKTGEIRPELTPDFVVILLHTLCSNLLEDYTFIKSTKEDFAKLKQDYTKFIIQSLERVLRAK